jgi:hypothetical protein
MSVASRVTFPHAGQLSVAVLSRRRPEDPGLGVYGRGMANPFAIEADDFTCPTCGVPFDAVGSEHPKDQPPDVLVFGHLRGECPDVYGWSPSDPNGQLTRLGTQDDVINALFRQVRNKLGVVERDDDPAR